MAKNRFKKIDVYDRNYVNDIIYYGHNGDIKPYMKALVEEFPQDDPDYLPRFRVLKVLESDDTYKSLGRMPVFGDIVTAGVEHVNEYKLTDDERNECKSLLKKFNDIKNTANWKIDGSFYEELSIGQKYFELSQLDERVFELNLGVDNVHSLEDAENWLLMHHPDYYMGCGISHSVPSGDFSIHPVPGPEYPDGQWETWAGRYEYVKTLADERGVKLGPIEHDRNGKLIKLSPGDSIKYVVSSDDSDKRLEVNFVVSQVVGKYPKMIYTMKVLDSDGKYADSIYPEGKSVSFSIIEVGHYFSDIDCNNKHMYLVSGRQKEYAEVEIESIRDEIIYKVPVKKLPVKDRYRELEHRVPSYDDEPEFEL